MRKKPRHQPISLVTELLLATAFLVFSLADATAQDSDASKITCGTGILDSANGHYDIGMFDKTVGDLNPCLPDGFGQKEERVGAYRLLALSYIATDSLDQARESIRQLLKTDSGYKPDLENDPPLYADMIEGMKPEWYTFMWKGGSPSRWMGRVAVVGTAVAVPFLLQDNSAPPLPGPPDLPSGAGQ